MTEATATPFTLEQRVEALETLIQHLVLVLECEPNFTAETLSRWTAMCTERLQRHNAASPGHLAALSRLHGMVLS